MKKLYITMLLLGMVILSLSSVSALEWDNVKSYDSVTREVTIKNAFGLGAEIGKARLNTPLNYKVAPGYQKVAEFDLWAYQDYNDILKSIEFYDKNKVDWQKNKIERTFDIKYKTYENVLIDDFETKCSIDEKSANKTQTCEQIKVGSHYENQEVWKKINPATLKKNEVVTIGIFTDVQVGDFVEWIPQIYGVKVEEWATWTADLNVGLFAYYKLDEGSGTIIDSLGNYNLTNSGATNISGKIKSAYNFSDDNLYTSSYPNPSWTEYTLAVWFNANTGASGKILEFEEGGDQNYDCRALWYSGGTFTGYACTGTSVVLPSGSASTGAWHLGVITAKANGQARAYIDGVSTQNLSITTLASSGNDFKIGSNPTNGQYFNGGIDEVGIWSRELTQSEIIQLWNGGSGISYINNFNSNYPNITLNSPSSANYTTSPQNIQMNFTAWDDINLSDVKLYVNGVLNQTNASGLNNSIYLFDLTLGDGDYTIYGKATDNESQSTNSSSIRIIIDSLAPTLELFSPLTNFTTLTLPINVTLNFTAQDESLDKCWYGYNGTNTTFTCNTNQTISINSSGAHSINYYANDTLGNEASNSTSFYVYYITRNATATNPITEGGISSHSFYLNMTNIASFNATAELYWNGTSYGLGTKTTLSNDSLRFDKNIIVPSINGTSVNWTWVYNISGNPNVTNYNLTGSQTYIKVNITECGAGTYQILNYTMYDQETRALGSTANASIEVDLTLTSQANTSLSWQYHATKSNATSFLICLPSGALNNSAYNLDSVSKYTYQDHVIQYHYIEKFNLTNSSIPQTIRLYPLATAKSTSFLVNYQDENYIYVENAVIDVWRRYIGDGVFFSVEHGKTDANGQTRLHLVTEDIIYKFLVWQDGELVYTSPEFLALCQATPCQINLRKSTTDQDGFSKRDNIIYDYSFNKTTRTASFTFATKDNTQTEINMTILSSNQYANETACSTTLTTSGGQIDCIIPTAFTNTSYQTIITKDGKYFGTAFDSLAPSSMEIFGYTGLILTAIAYLMLALMGISSGIATIIFGIIGLVFMGIIQVFESGNVFGMASAIIWLIVAGVIIIIKITKRRIQ